ncbi:hypothetical protein EJ03DRAFT_154136 [Teratosphaeria nubilosa]|uniref:Uncharacterized protein n=1 Tax=Teratosphaeria nubilosa TaxID=161662 RepID=A0A6G1LL07_9PEZI|nr:hypothetical protein EJ03DRAFT_154136 [Teratosphaeria nubilosa]
MKSCRRPLPRRSLMSGHFVRVRLISASGLSALSPTTYDFSAYSISIHTIGAIRTHRLVLHTLLQAVRYWEPISSERPPFKT